DFHRGASAYNRAQGDHQVTLGPLREGPFYAVRTAWLRTGLSAARKHPGGAGEAVRYRRQCAGGNR
ncbi:hypothetical protein C5706_28330, partial [Klebsiella pneumoniae]